MGKEKKNIPCGLQLQAVNYLVDMFKCPGYTNKVVVVYGASKLEIIFVK